MPERPYYFENRYGESDEEAFERGRADFFKRRKEYEDANGKDAGPRMRRWPCMSLNPTPYQRAQDPLWQEEEARAVRGILGKVEKAAETDPYLASALGHYEAAEAELRTEIAA